MDCLRVVAHGDHLDRPCPDVPDQSALPHARKPLHKLGASPAVGLAVALAHRRWIAFPAEHSCAVVHRGVDSVEPRTGPAPLGFPGGPRDAMMEGSKNSGDGLGPPCGGGPRPCGMYGGPRLPGYGGSRAGLCIPREGGGWGMKPVASGAVGGRAANRRRHDMRRRTERPGLAFHALHNIMPIRECDNDEGHGR